MKAQTLVVFAISVAVCTVAAGYRFYDSAHTIGTIKAGGGKARHPILLDRGRDSYTIIATATVLPPYRGDVRVAVEGEPAMEFEIYPDKPVIDLNPHHRPEFRDNTLYNLQPRDKVALWVVMKPGLKRPAAGARALAVANGGDDCCSIPPDEPAVNRHTEEVAARTHHEERTSVRGGTAATGESPGYQGRGTRGGAKQFLAFYDSRTNQPVLKVPIVYKEQGEKSDGSH